jgi:hypothetical protein
MVDVVEVDALTGEVIERAYTPEEAAQAVIDAEQSTAQAAVVALRAANTDTLHAQATTALTANRDFLALAAPTNAQTLAQVKMLTRESTGTIRLLLGLLDATD